MNIEHKCLQQKNLACTSQHIFFILFQSFRSLACFKRKKKKRKTLCDGKIFSTEHIFLKASAKCFSVSRNFPNNIHNSLFYVATTYCWCYWELLHSFFTHDFSFFQHRRRHFFFFIHVPIIFYLLFKHFLSLSLPFRRWFCAVLSIHFFPYFASS